MGSAAAERHLYGMPAAQAGALTRCAAAPPQPFYILTSQTQVQSPTLVLVPVPMAARPDFTVDPSVATSCGFPRTAQPARAMGKRVG